MSNRTQILSTISLDDALINKARENDIDIDDLPFIQISSNVERDLYAEMEELCGLEITAVFTSANAVHAIAHIVDSAKPKWNIYCIGTATRQAVLEHFDAPGINGTADDAASLAKTIIANGVYDIVFFCGNKRLDTLPDVLQQHHIKVHEVIVYQALETPHAITKQYDGILFFSPSAVKSFFKVNKINSDTVLFAIGNTTSSAVMQETGNKVIVSEKHSKEQLLDLAIDYFNKQLTTQGK